MEEDADYPRHCAGGNSEGGLGFVACLLSNLLVLRRRPVGVLGVARSTRQSSRMRKRRRRLGNRCRPPTMRALQLVARPGLGAEQRAAAIAAKTNCHRRRSLSRRLNCDAEAGQSYSGPAPHRPWRHFNMPTRPPQRPRRITCSLGEKGLQRLGGGQILSPRVLRPARMSPAIGSEDGGIGRRARFRSWSRKGCGFESRSSHAETGTACAPTCIDGAIRRAMTVLVPDSAARTATRRPG